MKQLLAFAMLSCVCAAQSANAQPLLFPMQGTWFVLQGPPCPGPGNHCQTFSNQLAYDLVPIDQFGHPNSPACMGRPIMAPSNGVVIEALNVYPDVPNQTQHPAGNHVVIQRSANEFITIAHLAAASLSVGVGSPVAAGRVIGACGFNGNTGGPHVHIHMQAGPNILNFATPPLPMPFAVSVRNPLTGACTPLGGNIMTMGMVTC